MHNLNDDQCDFNNDTDLEEILEYFGSSEPIDHNFGNDQNMNYIQTDQNFEKSTNLINKEKSNNYDKPESRSIELFENNSCSTFDLFNNNSVENIVEADLISKNIKMNEKTNWEFVQDLINKYKNGINSSDYTYHKKSLLPVEIFKGDTLGSHVLKRMRQIEDEQDLNLKNNSLLETRDYKKILFHKDNLKESVTIVDNQLNMEFKDNSLFSTGSGKKVSINEDHLKKAKQIIDQDLNIEFTKDSLFSTGSGKKVSINEDHLKKAKQIIDQDLNIEFTKDSLFSTGSGKKVSINEDHLKKAKQIIDQDLNIEFIKDSLFSTGNGKKVSINEDHLKKAKQIVGEEFIYRDENIPLNNMPHTTNEISRNEKIKINDVIDNKKTETTDLLYLKNNEFLKKKVPKLLKENLIIPNFFEGYIEMNYFQLCEKFDNLVSPTNILLDQSMECLKKYIFVLKKDSTNELDKYIMVDYDSIYNKMEFFFEMYPIFPKSLLNFKLRWFQIQYLLVLYDECLKWVRRIKFELKKSILDIKNTSHDKLLNLLNEILYRMNYPSIKKILFRLSKRAIYEFFDAKRSSIVKICEGDFTVSAPLNIRILNHIDTEFIDYMGDKQTKKIFICTDGWYIIKIHVFSNAMSGKNIMPRNIFVCGGNWLNSNIELGHPLEIEASNIDFPNLFYGINLIRPIRNLSGLRLGFHLKPLIFRICNLVTSSEILLTFENSMYNKSKSMDFDTGGGLVFLTQVVVIYMFPICYKETIENIEDNQQKKIYVTRDQNEMEISINNEIYETTEKNLQFSQSNLKENNTPIEANKRKITLDSKMLVLDYWKFQNFKNENKNEIYLFDLINNCSILTLPSGTNIDDISSIKPGTVIRLSWMKIVKLKSHKNSDHFFSKLSPTPKTSLNLKKRIKDDLILNKIINLVKKPLLLFEDNPEKIIQLKGGWPVNILGIILQIYPIEERKRGFEHCFEFRVLILSPLGSKIFIRVHTLGFHESELRMCERLNSKLRKVFDTSNRMDYKEFIILIENVEFNSHEKSTNLYYFNARVPYSVFRIPYYSGTEYFSSTKTQKMLSKKIKDLIYYTNCDLPLLFNIEEIQLNNLPSCSICGNYLTSCICTTNELEIL